MWFQKPKNLLPEIDFDILEEIKEDMRQQRIEETEEALAQQNEDLLRRFVDLLEEIRKEQKEQQKRDRKFQFRMTIISCVISFLLGLLAYFLQRIY